MRTRKPDKEEEEFDWWSAYQTREGLSKVGTELITFGVEEFYGAYIITNLDRLEEMVKIADGDPSKMIQHKYEVREFINFDLTDTVRICTCFENFAKALLINNGFLIHTFNGDRLKPLSRRQYKQPIPATYIQKSSITRSELSYKTVGMGQLLGDAYQEYVGFPKEDRDILEELNRSRNSLHLRMNMGTEFGEGLVADLRTLKTGLEPWVKRMQEASRNRYQ